MLPIVSPFSRVQFIRFCWANFTKTSKQEPYWERVIHAGYVSGEKTIQTNSIYAISIYANSICAIEASLGKYRLAIFKMKLILVISV
jgi:hypothetical protein